MMDCGLATAASAGFHELLARRFDFNKKVKVEDIPVTRGGSDPRSSALICGQ